MLQPFRGHPSAALYKQPINTSPGMQTVTLPSLGQAGYLFSLNFSSCEGREIPLSLWGGGTEGRNGGVCGWGCVCVCMPKWALPVYFFPFIFVTYKIELTILFIFKIGE